MVSQVDRSMWTQGLLGLYGDFSQLLHLHLNFFPGVTVRLFGRKTLGVFVKNLVSMLLAILQIDQQITFFLQNKSNLQFHLKKYNSSYAHFPLVCDWKHTKRQAYIKILGLPTKHTINDSKFEFLILQILTQSCNDFIFN